MPLGLPRMEVGGLRDLYDTLLVKRNVISEVFHSRREIFN